MEAINNYLLITPETIKESKSDHSGIIFTADDEKKVRFHEAVVNLAAPDCGNIPVGAKIVFDSMAGHDVKIDNVMYRIIRLPDVALIL